MKTINSYDVAGKTFSDKQEALNYEKLLRNNLELRARNLKLFYWRMLGYPGESVAINLINKFCHYQKFTFGKYKNQYVGEILMMFPDYIKWLIENVPSFTVNEEIKALYNTSWKHSIGGSSWNITNGTVINIPGEMPDYDIINWEKNNN